MINFSLLTQGREPQNFSMEQCNHVGYSEQWLLNSKQTHLSNHNHALRIGWSILKPCQRKARKSPEDDSLQGKFQLKGLNLGNSRKNLRQGLPNISLCVEVSKYFGTCNLCLYRLSMCKTYTALLNSWGRGSHWLFNILTIECVHHKNRRN